MNGFDSIQITFGNTTYESPFANTRQVQFNLSYLDVLKQEIHNIKTEYFWMFADFVDISFLDFDFIPEQHEKDQIHVWFNNSDQVACKEGNVFLIPTNAFKKQINRLQALREYDHVNYHPVKHINETPCVNANKKYRIHYTDKKMTRKFSSFWETDYGGIVFINDQSFDAVQVRFNTDSSRSPWKNTRDVDFTKSYLDTVKTVIDDIKTEYFWMFADFVDMSTADIYYVPDAIESDQIHTWYKPGSNKEGNLFLIPTKSFKQQLPKLKCLRDYQQINYHKNETLQEKSSSNIYEIHKRFNKGKKLHIKLVDAESNIDNTKMYPSFWENSSGGEICIKDKNFDSVQVRFKNTKTWPSPFENTRIVPFVDSYLTVLKSVIDDIKTEYFWFFANFMDLKTVDKNFIPDVLESDQIHVWYNTHPLGGTNKEGNVFLIPTRALKQQISKLKYLRDYRDIKYHAHDNLFQNWLPKTVFDLQDPIGSFQNDEPKYYRWMVNKDLNIEKMPNFFPSYWEDEKIYTWGPTKDIMLIPYRQKFTQFYDVDRHVHFDYDYEVKPMDIVFLSYDEPNAQSQFEKLRKSYPRAKWCKGINMRSLAYITAAQMSETDYFFFVTPKQDLVESFKFDFQPDRMKNPCHYIFNARNPVTGLEYGHGAVLLYNKKLVMETARPGLDFTLSAPHDYVPILSCVNRFNQTAIMSWRTTFREVLKLLQMTPTVESKYRLKKWMQLGTDKYADYVYLAAKDATEYYQQHKHDISALKKSFELDWLNEQFKQKYQ